MNIKKGAFYIFFILTFINASAQKEIKFNKITAEDGLSQKSINHIIQDHKGFIWIATNGGLNRFDGIQFKTFTYNGNDSNSISNNIINHLFEDKKGNIWISTQNGLNLYNSQNHSFTSFKNELNNPSSLSHNQISCTITDNAGNYWIGTDGGGLNKFDPHTKSFQTYRNTIHDPQSISSNHITCLEKDKYGFIWIGTQDNGLNMLDPITGKFLRYVKGESLIKNSLSSNQINTIYEDNEGDLWVGTSEGIDRMKPRLNGRDLSNRDEVINFHEIATPKNSAASKSITSIYQGASGLVWFGTVDHGLGYINKYQKAVGNYTVNPNNDFSLLSNNVTSVFDDKTGILWIGTNAGINIIDKLKDRFEWHKRIPGKGNTLSSNNIQSIYRESNGVIWLGTHDQGLTKYDPLSDVYTNYMKDDYLEEGSSIKERNSLMRKFDQRKKRSATQRIYYLSHNRINAIQKISRNTLWVGTGGGGINILNTYSGSIKTIQHNPDNDSSLSSNNVKCIFKDSNDRIWVGTEDAGLNLSTINNFTRFTMDENDIFSISSNHIRSIVEDKDGNIWIGTFGGGINKYDPVGQRFIRYFYHESNWNSLSSNNIYTIYTDASSKLWIGTSDGLNILDIDTDQVQHLTVSNGLPSNSVYSILDDTKGNLWISTNKGISRVNKKTRAIKNYDKEDGLQSTEFNPSTGFYTSKGEMLFGSINGYCTFYPTQISDNISKPEIVFTDFKILNESVSINSPGSPLKKNISETDTLILSHKDVSISFEFVALNFTDSKKNQYAYKMENFEDKWNYVGTRTFANYTNLLPGNYNFRVKASNNDGIWNEEGKSIFIIVKPPFWQTWWFYSILALAFVGTIILIIQLRTRTLHRSKVLLEDQVKQRTRQIKNQNKVLENANKEIVDQKDEIESQNKLLKQKNSEITKAKSDLDKINKELVDINTNLEEKVEKRTSSLKKINHELTNANDELDKFIYRASHDLKGPIARLLGVSILAKMDNKDETLKEYIELIEKGAFDINKVLNKLNNIHFINKEIVQTEVIDFDKIINNCKPNLSTYIDLSDLHISLKTSPGFQLRSDFTLMKIIFDNLLENAVIFKKTKKAYVDIHLKSDKKSIIISVADNGLGILKDQLDKVFDMFYRGSQRSKGNGLGLYLVRKAVQKLQGDITVESEEGKYTCFTIALPKVIVSRELQSLMS